MSDGGRVTWHAISCSYPSSPPFEMYHLEGPLRCEFCDGPLRYGSRWSATGWMCGVRECQVCNQVHLIIDSKEFCDNCTHYELGCLELPRVYVRGDRCV